jgi:hypothetical protein
MQMIYLSTTGVTDVVLRSYLPWIADLAWVSENCSDMNVYILKGTMPIDYQSSRERRASMCPGIFDFIYKGRHYQKSYFDFELDVLGDEKNGMHI